MVDDDVMKFCQISTWTSNFSVIVHILLKSGSPIQKPVQFVYYESMKACIWPTLCGSDSSYLTIQGNDTVMEICACYIQNDRKIWWNCATSMVLLSVARRILTAGDLIYDVITASSHQKWVTTDQVNVVASNNLSFSSKYYKLLLRSPPLYDFLGWEGKTFHIHPVLARCMPSSSHNRQIELVFK